MSKKMTESQRKMIAQKAIKMQGNELEIKIFDEIGFWGINYEDFDYQLSQFEKVEKIKVRLHSIGGDVVDGFAIYDRLRLEAKRGAEVEIVIEGLAASMASVIAMAGTRVLIAENAMLMIHRPWGFAVGESDDFRKQADLLDTYEEKGIKAYQSKAKELSAEELKQMLADETWISSEDALLYGFVDAVLGDESDAVGEKPQFSLAMAMRQFTTDKMPEEAKARFFKKDVQNPQPAQMRQSQGEHMPDKIKGQNPGAPDNAPDKKQVEKEIAAQLQAKFSLLDSLSADYADVIGEKEISKLKSEISSNIADKSEDAIRVAFAEATLKAAKTVPTNPTKVTVGKSQTEKLGEAARVSFALQAGLKVEDKEVAEVRKAGLAGMGIQGYVRAQLIEQGVPNAASMNSAQLADAGVRMVGTGDFPNVLEDVANKALVTGMEEANATYQMFVGRESVTDFKTKNLVKTSGVGDFQEILENENIPMTTMSDSKETVSVSTKGVGIRFTRKMLINDDLGAFVAPARLFGRGLERKKDRDAYETLFGAAGLGPTMNEDSKTLFHADHSNWESSGAAPSESTLAVGRRAMRKQKLLEPGEPNGKAQYLNVSPEILLAYGSDDITVEQLLGSPYSLSATSAAPMTKKPDFFNRLTPVFSPVFDELCDAAGYKSWYMLANPVSFPAIVYVSLAGYETPMFRRRDSQAGEALGMVFDAVADFGFGAVEWRTAYGNRGAAV